MEKVLIRGKEYSFIKDYKDNDFFRRSFNSLTQKTYGFDFEQYYQSGYWGIGYIPYSLSDGETIVANVSASVSDCLVLGEHKKYIQIGTVMTDYAYRNQGLSRYLMEKVIDEYDGKCDLIYLFANDSVLNFYPKFGFNVMNEYQCSTTITNDNKIIVDKKLDMSLDANKELVVDKINSSITMSKLSIINNVGGVMFYCTSFMSDNVYYLKEHDVIVVAEFENDTLYLNDVFSSSEVVVNDIIKELANKEVKTVVLGFTPNVTDNYCINLLKKTDTTLFIMKNKTNIFENNKLMFPILSHT